MNLDLDHLSCSDEQLVGFIQILKQVRPSHLCILAMDNKLRLTASSTTGYHAEDVVWITIPYAGKRTEGFVSVEDFEREVGTGISLLQLTNAKKPPVWHPVLGARKRHLISLQAPALAESLEYLLRPNLSGVLDGVYGVIITKKELAVTNGHQLHIDSTQPSLVTEGLRLLGFNAASALFHTVRRMPTAKVLGGYQPIDQTGFVFHIRDTGIEVFISSKPNPDLQTQDSAEARIGDERNASFTVYSEQLIPILNQAVKFTDTFNQRHLKQQIRGRPVVTLEHALHKETQVLKIYAWAGYTDIHHADRTEEDDGFHVLISHFTNGFKPGRKVSLNPTYVLEAIRGLGPYVQFSLPYHPVDGLEHCELNPVYITGDPGRFAMVAPIQDPSLHHAVSRQRAQKLRGAANDIRAVD